MQSPIRGAAENTNMKLLYCPHCNGIFSLATRRKRCNCNLTYGKYCLDGEHITISDGAVVMEIKNNDFFKAIVANQEEKTKVGMPMYVLHPKDESIKRIE